MQKTLKVRAVGTALVLDLESMEAGVRKFVGRKFVSVEGGRHGFDIDGRGDAEVPNTEPYRYAVRCGDLEPRDRSTALECGVPWVAPKAAPEPAPEPEAPASEDVPDAPDSEAPPVPTETKKGL